MWDHWKTLQIFQLEFANNHSFQRRIYFDLPKFPVPKTNRISEADFSALDRLEKNAPQKSTLAKSGIINYTNNKTSTFLNQISRDKRKKYFTLARRAALKRSRGDKHRKSAFLWCILFKSVQC
jgi:hypothetical protein